MECNVNEIALDRLSEPLGSMAERIGDMFSVSLLSPYHRRLSTADYFRGIRMPMELGQCQIYYNNFGICLGYITWALLAPDVLARLVGNPRAELKMFEWNEGCDVWISDFSVRPGGALSRILRDFRDRLFINENCITYFRPKGSRLIVKRIERSSLSHFFKDFE